MKKIFSLSILILTLCFGSCVFGARAWSEVEFEKFINLVGYGEIDLDEFTFPTGTYNKNSFLSNLKSTSYGMVVLRGNNDSLDGFDSDRFHIFFLNPTSKNQLFNRKNMYNLGSVPRFY